MFMNLRILRGEDSSRLVYALVPGLYLDPSSPTPDKEDRAQVRVSRAHARSWVGEFEFVILGYSHCFKRGPRLRLARCYQRVHSLPEQGPCSWDRHTLTNRGTSTTTSIISHRPWWSSASLDKGVLKTGKCGGLVCFSYRNTRTSKFSFTCGMQPFSLAAHQWAI